MLIKQAGQTQHELDVFTWLVGQNVSEPRSVGWMFVINEPFVRPAEDCKGFLNPLLRLSGWIRRETDDLG